MTTFLTGIQYINLLVMAVTVGACIYVAWRWPIARALIVVPVAWSVFGVVFYLFVLTGRLSPTGVLVWGAIHRMLAALIILGVVAGMWAILRDDPPDGLYDD